jgi:hypothetical protein
MTSNAKNVNKEAWILWGVCALPGYLITLFLIWISQAGVGVSMLGVLVIGGTAMASCTALSLYFMRRNQVGFGIFLILLMTPTTFAVGITVEEIKTLISTRG